MLEPSGPNFAPHPNFPKSIRQFARNGQKADAFSCLSLNGQNVQIKLARRAQENLMGCPIMRLGVESWATSNDAFPREFHIHDSVVQYTERGL